MADDIQSKASELVKKVLTVGVSTIFLGEESVRKLIADFKLPTELLGGLLESANKTKAEFLKNFSSDIVNTMMDKVDQKKLIQDVLNENDIELNVKISFKPRKKKGGA